jgi:hypothetical protein
MSRESKVVRAEFDDETVAVYQAFSPVIADEALRLGTFGPAFSLGRMTWVKPSFGWMLYRSGYGRKPGQERVLRISIRHDGFRAALAAAVPSSYQAHLFAERSGWDAALRASPVRYQWDPDRDLRLVILPRRAIQLGIAGPFVRRYVDEWIARIEDVTDLAHAIEGGARPEVPEERPYPLDRTTLRALGCTDDAPALAP